MRFTIDSVICSPALTSNSLEWGSTTVSKETRPRIRSLKFQQFPRFSSKAQL